MNGPSPLDGATAPHLAMALLTAHQPVGIRRTALGGMAYTAALGLQYPACTLLTQSIRLRYVAGYLIPFDYVPAHETYI